MFLNPLYTIGSATHSLISASCVLHFYTKPMFRPAFLIYPETHSERWRNSWSGLLVPFALWICVAVTLKYGSYGDRNLILGPNSSRLVTTSSIFVKQVQVIEQEKKGVSVYEFSEKPELTLVTNWNISRNLLIGSYRRQGFSLWLNEGSSIRMKWTTHMSDLDNILVELVKGEQRLETLSPYVSNPTNSKNIFAGNGNSIYSIEEDENYYIGIVNMSPRDIMMSMDVNISSTMYDTSKSTSKCSTINGFCQLKLLFPSQKFAVLTTPNNENVSGWYVDLSFVARLFTYIVILGVLVIILSLIMKYLIAYGDNTNEEEVRTMASETAPLVSNSEKALPFSYGSLCEEDEELGLCKSSDDLYDGKICVICYDESRNCFFVPCGHCATCYTCAQRILDGENKVCPICRRFIHKLRKIV